MKNFTFLAALLAVGPIICLGQCPTNAGKPSYAICNNFGSNFLTIGPTSADPSYSYSWEPVGSISDPNDPNPTVFPTTTTTYTMTVFGPGCFGTYSTTVNVTGAINITAPNGSIEHPVTYNDIWFISGTAPSVILHSDVNADWYESGTKMLSNSKTYTYTPSGTTSEDPYFSIATKDDGGNSCSYTDLLYFTTHPALHTTDYPVTVILNYSPSSCISYPILPATITQTTSLGSGTNFDWAFTGGNTTGWSFSSISGNTAMLHHNTGGNSVTITARAINTSAFFGAGQSDWMIWPATDNPVCTANKPSLLTGAGSQLSPSVTTATLYPNPANSFVTVTTPDLIKTIEISSFAGITIKRITPGLVRSYNVSTGDLPSGTYLCKLLLANGNIQNLQFVIAK